MRTDRLALCGGQLSAYLGRYNMRYVLLAALASCAGPGLDTVQLPLPTNGVDGAPGLDGQAGVDGQDGEAGTSGLNGKSLISQSRAASNIECPASLGTAVDIYLDMDNSFTVSAGDQFQSGLVACNGIAGTNGANAVASVAGFGFTNTTACQDLGNNRSANKSSTTTDSIRIYPNSTCQGSAINTLGEGGDEIYYLSDNIIYIVEGNNSGTIAPLTIRRVVFNL